MHSHCHLELIYLLSTLEEFLRSRGMSAQVLGCPRPGSSMAQRLLLASCTLWVCNPEGVSTPQTASPDRQALVLNIESGRPQPSSSSAEPHPALDEVCCVMSSAQAFS